MSHPFDIFANPTDMENYGPEAIEYAMENIKVLDNKVLKKGGRRCNAHDWATVHWKTYDYFSKKMEVSRHSKIAPRPQTWPLRLQKMLGHRHC